MRKIIPFSILFFFNCTQIKAQDNYSVFKDQTAPASNYLINFNQVYNFSHSAMYDFSIKRLYNQSACDAIVGIDIDNMSQGTLTFFLIEKLKFKINTCVINGEEYHFDLINPNGKSSKAIMIAHLRKLESFSLCINNDDTWIVLTN